MSRFKGALLAFALAWALGLAPAAPAEAAKPTVAGKITGKLPPKSKALTEIRVLNLSQARTVASATPKRRGAFRLALEPGAYLLVASTIPEHGRSAATRVVPLTLAAGQRRTSVRIRKPARGASAAARAPVAHTAYTQERGGISPGNIAFTIERFTGATGDLSVLNRGLSEMLQSDLGATACRTTEVANSSDIKLVEHELALGRSRYFDPASVPRRNFIRPDIKVVGRLSGGGSHLGYTLTLIDARTGATLETLSGTMPADQFFQEEPKLAKRLAGRICAYGEVFEVTFTGTGGADFATNTATADLSAQPITAPPTARDAGGPTRWEGSAPIAWSNLAMTSKIDCSYSDPITAGGNWTATLRRIGTTMEVEWRAEGAASVTATVTCPGGPPIPGQPAVALLGSGPMKFTLPDDAKQPVTGGLMDGGYGWNNTLEMKVRTVRVQRL